MSDAPHQTVAVDQAYAFACGELSSRFEFAAGGVRARVQVITFCSRQRFPCLRQRDDVVLQLARRIIADACHEADLVVDENESGIFRR